MELLRSTRSWQWGWSGGTNSHSAGSAEFSVVPGTQVSQLQLAALLSELMGLRIEMWASSAKRNFEVREQVNCPRKREGRQ